MVVGYSLGNRGNQEEDIQVLGEDEPDVLTYSKAVTIVLSRMCRNKCPYCAFSRRDNVTVPYSMIKWAKKARAVGVREAIFAAGERADKFAHVRALLDLWGFDSYIDYIYTVCELGFLEGVIPVLEVGFLSPSEMRRVSEVVSLFKIMLDSVNPSRFDQVYPNSPGKKIELRLKLLEWASKLKVPIVTGLLVGIGESKSHKKEMLNTIGKLHQEYGMIHEVVLQNFIPEPGTAFYRRNPPNKKVMLETAEMALEILPKDISVIVPLEMNPDYEDFIRAGIRDLGRIQEGRGLITPQTDISMEKIEQLAEKLGFRIQQRFPLRKSFIQANKYSSKLGQVFDSYSYKIKKHDQEKLKEAKLTSGD